MKLYETTFAGGKFIPCKGSHVSVNDGRILVNDTVVATRGAKNNVKK